PLVSGGPTSVAPAVRECSAFGVVVAGGGGAGPARGGRARAGGPRGGACAGAAGAPRDTRAGCTARAAPPSWPARGRLSPRGADGRNSFVARRLGLWRPEPRHRRWAVMAHCRGVQVPDDHGEMIITPYGYCGVNPLPDGLANVCVVVDRVETRRPGPAGTRLAGFFRDLLASHPLTAGPTAGAHIVAGPWAPGRLACRAACVAIPRSPTSWHASPATRPTPRGSCGPASWRALFWRRGSIRAGTRNQVRGVVAAGRPFSHSARSATTWTATCPATWYSS